MTPEHIDNLRTLLVEACDKHLANGGKIIARNFRYEQINACCPIYCLIGDTSLSLMGEKLKELLHTTDVLNAWEFIDAFDGRSSGLFGATPLSSLGLELRKKYIKE